MPFYSASEFVLQGLVQKNGYNARFCQKNGYLAGFWQNNCYLAKFGQKNGYLARVVWHILARIRQNLAR